MATIPHPSTDLPAAGEEMLAAQLTDWVNAIIDFLETTNLDEANVDLSSTDGLMGKSTAQTLTGLKTFENVAAAAGGLREVVQFGIDPASGTQTINDGSRVIFYMDNNAGTETDFATLDVQAIAVAAGAESVQVRFRGIVAGSAEELAEFGSVGTVFPGTYTRPLILGGLYIWYDSTNVKLMAKATAPSSATDGVEFTFGAIV